MVILKDSPYQLLWLHDGFSLHYQLQNIDRLIAGLIEFLRPDQKLDHILLADLLVMSEEDMAADIWAHHVCLKQLYRGLRPFV